VIAMMNITRDEAGLPTIHVSGRLEKQDYEKAIPELEKALNEGTTRALLELDDFKGFTPAALIEELKFDIRHRKDFDRIAVVGSSTMEELGVRLIRPFFSGQVRIFEKERRSEAEAWLHEPPLHS
jgi:hypothetical protein